MTYGESELLPISALQHLLFCERQCALIHVEQEWEENRLTAEGRVLHNRSHDPGHESRGRKRAVRGLPVRSLALGVAGVCDVVEFQAPPGGAASALSSLTVLSPRVSLNDWVVYPIEYKRGSGQSLDCDSVQLCAQALCLEEMIGVQIPVGALFYGEERRRKEVKIDSALRKVTTEACQRLRAVLDSVRLPPAVPGPYCKQCSLFEKCMPTITGGTAKVREDLSDSINAVIAGATPEQD